MFNALEADMWERIIELEEENKLLKTEIEKIKLDYIMRAVKLNRDYKQTADEYSDKYYQKRIEWSKSISELREKIDKLQNGNKDLMFYKVLEKELESSSWREKRIS